MKMCFGYVLSSIVAFPAGLRGRGCRNTRRRVLRTPARRQIPAGHVHAQKKNLKKGVPDLVKFFVTPGTPHQNGRQPALGAAAKPGP
jgi:hypothetical protein